MAVNRQVSFKRSTSSLLSIATQIDRSATNMLIKLKQIHNKGLINLLKPLQSKIGFLYKIKLEFSTAQSSEFNQLFKNRKLETL